MLNDCSNREKLNKVDRIEAHKGLKVSWWATQDQELDR